MSERMILFFLQVSSRKSKIKIYGSVLVEAVMSLLAVILFLGYVTLNTLVRLSEKRSKSPEVVRGSL